MSHAALMQRVRELLFAGKGARCVIDAGRLAPANAQATRVGARATDALDRPRVRAMIIRDAHSPATPLSPCGMEVREITLEIRVERAATVAQTFDEDGALNALLTELAEDQEKIRGVLTHWSNLHAAESGEDTGLVGGCFFRAEARFQPMFYEAGENYLCTSTQEFEGLLCLSCD